MKKELDKIQENFGEITDNLQKLGHKLRNDFVNGTMMSEEGVKVLFCIGGTASMNSAVISSSKIE